MRVFIVVADPTGLPAAVELARQGVTSDVIDQIEKASTQPGAVGTLPSSLKRLAPSGVTDQ